MRMHEIASDIWTIAAFANRRECEGLIARAESRGVEGATITTQRGAERDAGVRNNDRVIIDDPDLAAELWERLRADVPPFVSGRQAIGLNERFRFYRYDPRQQFRGHVDHPYARSTGEES